MRFRILGPVEVRGDDGLPVPLRPQQVRVLAVLLLAPNQVVARQRLIDELWPYDPPATAKTQIQNCVSALRRGIPAEIDADGPGYRLRTAPTDLDAQLFQQQLAAAEVPLARGDLATAARELRAALDLWRGPALAGFTGRIVEAGAARLDELRLATLERWADVELRLGRQHELVGELAELVAAHPLRERLIGLLMLALYRSGRQAEALAEYRALRTRLAEEFGLDPGPEIAELHAAILRNETGTAEVKAPGVVPRQLPAGARHFVGRADELKELTRLVEETARGTVVPIAVIDGTAGIGKTTVAVHWAHQVASSFPDGQLYLNLRGFDPSAPPVTAAEAVRAFLDALAVPPDQIPGSVAAQINLYRSLLSGRRVLVVLDNARDVDQVRPLLPGSAGCLAVVTSRNHLTGLVANEGAHPVTLALMSTVEAQELLGRHLGPERLAAEPAAVDALVERCVRLPLALAVVAARAAVHPTFPLALFAADLADVRRRLDGLDAGDPATHLRAVFSWSYGRLGPPAARLFRLLGVHPGPDISAPAAASLAGLAVEQVRPLLAELARTHLVSEHAPGRFAFHDLLRAYAAELAAATDPPADRRAALRRAADHYLHSGDAAAQLLNPQRQIPLDPPDPAVTPEGHGDAAAAMAWFQAEHAVLLALVERVAAEDLEAAARRLPGVLTTYLYRQGHWEDWIRTQRLSLAATERRGDRAAQATARRNLGLAYSRLGRAEESRAEAQRALELYAAEGDHESQARCHLDFGWLCQSNGEYAEGVEHVERALALFRTVGHRGGEATALNGLGWLYVQLGDAERALGYCREALALFQDVGDRYCEAGAWDTLGLVHHHRGDHAEAVACFTRSLEMFREVGDRYYEAEVLGRLGTTRHAAGDPDQARDAWQQALAIMRDLNHTDADEIATQLAALSG